MGRFLHSTLCLMVLFLTPVIAQRNQGGFIAPGDSILKLMPHEKLIFLPQEGFTFYDVPNGEFKGKILPGPPLENHDQDEELDTLMSSTITGAYIRPQLLSLDTYFETSDDRYHLIFDKQVDNHVRVLSNSYNGWIALDEIYNKGFFLVSWMEFYGEEKGRMIHPREKIAPVLMNPYPDAKVIAMADELYSEISSTGKCEGSYCLVKVTKYMNPYDATKTKEQNIVRKYRGWLRIIDDDGKPLVAHNSHGE